MRVKWPESISRRGCLWQCLTCSVMSMMGSPIISWGRSLLGLLGSSKPANGAYSRQRLEPGEVVGGEEAGIRRGTKSNHAFG